MIRRHRQRGVTLIELMIVVVILAIITSFAYPSYVEYIIDTKRTSAKSLLLQIAGRQQQFFMDNKQYAPTLSALGFDEDVMWVDDQAVRTEPGDIDSVYVFGLANVTPTGYLAFAVPVNGQQRDWEDCGAFLLDQTGNRQSTGTEDDCW